MGDPPDQAPSPQGVSAKEAEKGRSGDTSAPPPPPHSEGSPVSVNTGTTTRPTETTERASGVLRPDESTQVSLEGASGKGAGDTGGGCYKYGLRKRRRGPGTTTSRSRVHSDHPTSGPRRFVEESVRQEESPVLVLG